jgi:hypothetical protein
MAGMTAEEAFAKFQQDGQYANHPGHFASEEEWSKYKHMVPQAAKKAFRDKVAGNEERYAEGRAQGLTPSQMGVFDQKEMGQALLRRMEMGNLDKGYDYDWASGFKTNVGTSDLSKRGKERIPITMEERRHQQELEAAKRSGTNIYQQHRQAQIADLLRTGAIESDGAGGFRNPGPGGGESYGANLEGYNLGQSVFGRGRGTGGASTPGGGYTPGTISGPVREGDTGFSGPKTGGGFQAPPGVSTGQPASAPPPPSLRGDRPGAPPPTAGSLTPAPAGGMTTGQPRPSSAPEPLRAPSTPGPQPGTAAPRLVAPPGVNTGGQPGRPPAPSPMPSPLGAPAAAPVRSAAPPVAPPIPAAPAGGVQPAATPAAPVAPAVLQTTRVPTAAEFSQLGPGATAQTPWGQVVPKADGRPQLVLDEAGKAAYVQARTQALARYGAAPSWASGPGMPPPPVEPGRANFNVFTGQWS